MNRIVFEQQSESFGIAQIVDRGYLESPLILQQRAKDIAADPAKPIDPNFDGGHEISS